MKLTGRFLRLNQVRNLSPNGIALTDTHQPAQHNTRKACFCKKFILF